MAIEIRSVYIAWWGAGLSTLLSIVKFYELWQNRFRVEVGGKFTSDENIGNEILFRNLFNRPLIITYWELLYCTERWPLRKFDLLESAGYDDGDRRLNPHATQNLIFSDDDYFATSPKTLRGRRIYIRLYFAGRNSTDRRIYK